ncbi:MAG: hypothetical protein F6J89_14835 [Symploca sp. SIO1C4]|uniref:Uncharacterized protein n=1 Tax=Symploca sp. SIO1C4 TaxID=2607765 RepID=A0A6B3N6Y6_9CYAN|nr:hypothetical protein [Symploca sp. SIO1C4]
MPFCQSALIAFLTSRVARFALKELGYEDKTVRKFQAVLGGGAGLITAGMTADPGGALLTGIIAVLDLNGYEIPPELIQEEAHG